MKMKKWLSGMLVVLLLFPLFPSQEISATYNTNSAQTYLTAHSNSPWSTMALVALESSSIPTAHLAFVNGTNAIDYAAPILAITAVGQNPRAFASTDYVAALKNYYSEGQIGDVATLNDDFFGILALVSAGEPLSDPVIIGAKNFILSQQNDDGGWGFTITSDSDTNMTAAAILALLAAGNNGSDSHIQEALSFLQSQQNDDGGFPYYSGSASDSSSTSWVIWALNALNINPSNLIKFNQTPISYLESNQSEEGFFKFQNDSNEDAFSAVTTAYATIALEGGKLPFRIITNNDNDQAPKFSFRIEGLKKTICAGEVAGLTTLDIIKNAGNVCGFTYEIEDTDWGLYLKKINNDEAAGMTGWLYLINNSSPAIGAADYQLQTNDSVLWYYGDFNWQPTKLVLSTEQAGANQSVTATVEFFSDNLWSSLAEATIYFGAETATTDSNGQAIINLSDGFYKVFAQKQNYIRSNSVLLEVGQPAASSVNLNVTIEQGEVEGEGANKDTISFTVNPSDLDFGVLSPGSSAVKNVTVSNNGNADIRVETMIGGDPLFVENLDLNNIFWKSFGTEIDRGDSQNVAVELSVPTGYSDGGGTKSAQLTFWAMAR